MADTKPRARDLGIAPGILSSGDLSAITYVEGFRVGQVTVREGARLNDIRARVLTSNHFIEAIEAARSGPVTESAVGAGTGSVAFGFKGGIGTSSRKLPDSLGGFVVGVLVQTNFGGVLSIDGLAVGEELGQYYLRDTVTGA